MSGPTPAAMDAAIQLADEMFRLHGKEYPYAIALALDAFAERARQNAVNDCVRRTSQQIAVLGAVLIRNPCRTEICRSLANLNKEFRALAPAPGDRAGD